VPGSRYGLHRVLWPAMGMKYIWNLERPGGPGFKSPRAH